MKWGPPAYISAGMAIGIKPKFVEAKEPDLTFEELMMQLAPEGIG